MGADGVPLGRDVSAATAVKDTTAWRRDAWFWDWDARVKVARRTIESRVARTGSYRADTQEGAARDGEEGAAGPKQLAARALPLSTLARLIGAGRLLFAVKTHFGPPPLAYARRESLHFRP